MPIKIAILGWGSLLWDHDVGFDKQHHKWLFDGPVLKLEFSRISKSRSQALTLVIDADNGASCRVAYTLSKRINPEDAICDLTSREETKREHIGLYFLDGSRQHSRDLGAFESISAWATSKGIDVVIWTDLESNFKKKSIFGQDFSVETAISHIVALDAEGKAEAVEYIRRAPDFIDTPLRKALREYSWFR